MSDEYVIKNTDGEYVVRFSVLSGQICYGKSRSAAARMGRSSAYGAVADFQENDKLRVVRIKKVASKRAKRAAAVDELITQLRAARSAYRDAGCDYIKPQFLLSIDAYDAAVGYKP